MEFKVLLEDGFFCFGYIFSILICRLLAEVAYLQKGIASVDKIDLKMFSVWHPYRKVRLNFENFEQGKALLKFRKGSEFSMDKCCFSSDLLLYDWSRKVSDKILYYPGPIFIKLFNKRLKNWVQTHKTIFYPNFSLSFFFLDYLIENLET